MKNPILDKIKAFAIKELTNAYGYCGLAEGDEIVMLNCSDADNNDIAIKIEWTSVAEQKKQEEFEQQTQNAYTDDDSENLPNE